MRVESEIYLPAVANFKADLDKRYEILETAWQRGIKTGFMLVIHGPKDLEEESIKSQLKNLEAFVKLDQEVRPSVFIMHPNMPIDGPNKFNLFKNPEWSINYVKKSIDFASLIPQEVWPISGQIVSFHLNTLIERSEWNPDQEYWNKQLLVIADHIQKIREYALKKNIGIAIETTPIPEFGDTPVANNLGNPWPLLPWRSEIDLIRKTGSQLTIDWCHTYIAMRTINEIDRITKTGNKNALDCYMVFGSDLMHSQSFLDFSNQILSITQNGDIIHANDASGIFETTELQGKDNLFKEGVPLFEGDIPKKQLITLIKECLRKKTKFVLEVNETDFARSPNTVSSLKKILALAD